MTRSKLSRALEFWGVLLIPWGLDIVGGRAILATLFGAILWGMAVVLAAVRPRTINPSLKTAQGWVLAFISGSWLSYWGLAFVEAPRRISLEPESIRWLTLLHASLLTAGMGIVLIMAVAAALWLAQDASLRRSSWERRASRLKLPPLEALASLCERSLHLAFSAWGLGVFLAVLTAMLRWPRIAAGESAGTVAWWIDPKVVATVVLWLALALGFQFSLSVPAGTRWIYKFYIAIALLFVAFFYIFMGGAGSAIHMPLNWFV
ncbi:MAG: hypothetical protein JST16_08275 [Bdellovibrionales bacterium]|nr:hypothetical protein [Bdellovibrionales bacterium]